jgi:hypothetical protein
VLRHKLQQCCVSENVALCAEMKLSCLQHVLLDGCKAQSRGTLSAANTSPQLIVVAG